MDRDYLKLIEGHNIIAWIINNNIKTERGFEFDFDKFSFMIEPYLDWTPEQGVRKCTQIGWSVMTNLKLLWAAKYGIPGWGVNAANVIYTLPSDSDVSAFVPSKTNLLITENKAIKDFMRDEHGNMTNQVDSIQRKKIGNSMVYFKGTRSKTAAIMLTSDLNIHDEADRSEPEIIDQYESRLETSEYKGRWIFSNPSAPNMPADQMYLLSDQKHWFIKCEHCGHWQYLDWVRLSEVEFKIANHCYVDDTNMKYVCGKCAMPITDENRKRGKWVGKYPSRSISGYWVSHMMCSWKSVRDLHKLERGPNGDGRGAKSKAYFSNFVKGIPYVGSDVVVDETTIVNNMVLGQVRWERGKVAMGIDNGNRKHYVIGDERGIWEIGETRDWEDIIRLIKKYDPYYVVDLNPYPNMARKITKAYPKGKASFYVDGNKDLELVRWGKIGTDTGNMVYPDRERVIDKVIEEIYEGKYDFYGSKAYWDEYIKHWESLYQANMVGQKIIQEESLANADGLKKMRKSWLSSTGEDHYVHATVYWWVAMMKLRAAGGSVMRGTNTDVMHSLSRELGGIKTTPQVNPDTGNQIVGKTFIPDLTVQKKKKL